MERDKVIGYPDDLVGNLNKDGFDSIVEFLHELGVANRGVGLELSSLLLRAVEKVKVRLPKARIVDCTGAATLIRLAKSDLEISFYEGGGRHCRCWNHARRGSNGP